jgi:hypothetical protein
MRYLILLFLLFGCHSTPEDEAAYKNNMNKWARYLIDCPTAEITITSSSDGKMLSSNDDTYFIMGCGLKICCIHDNRGADSCFPCRKEQWYRNNE